MFIAVYDVEVAYPKIFTSDENCPHTIIIHFIKKRRTLYAEVDRYTISIKRFKMCTFEGLLVMINLELLIHFPTEYIELRLFTFCILMC